MSARIQPVEVAQAEGRTQELLGAVKSKLGKVPNALKTMGHSPALLEAYLGLSGALSRGVLVPASQERVALVVSQENGCEYCLSAHSLTAKRAGLNPDQVRAARRGEADDSQAQALLNFVQHLLQNRGDVTDEQLAEARAAGLTDAELLEAVGHVALTTLTNFVNQLAHTEVDFPRVAVALEEVSA